MARPCQVPSIPILALALLPLAVASAFEPRMVPEPPPPASWRIAVVEGSLPGHPSSNLHALARDAVGHLYLRVFPPARGRYSPIPFVAATRSEKEIAVFEVAPATHAPVLPPRGWADLGPIPPEPIPPDPPPADLDEFLRDKYTVRVEIGDSGVRTFRLVLESDRITLAPVSGTGRLEVAAGSILRLPSGTFTWRFDWPNGSFNRDAVRKTWEASLASTPSLTRIHPGSEPLSDPVFQEYLEDGSHAYLAKRMEDVWRLVYEMCQVTDANLILRWYGGALWDTREIRAGIFPDPHWLPNLKHVLPGARRTDTFSPEAPHRVPHVVSRLGWAGPYWGSQPLVPFRRAAPPSAPGGSRTSPARP